MAFKLQDFKNLYNNLALKIAVNPQVNRVATGISNIPQRTAQSFVNTANFLTTAPGISQVGYQFPRQYAQGQISQPIQQGVQQLRQPGIFNKVTGALGVGQGVLGATPAGASFNAGIGAVGGALQGIRTGKPILKSAYSGVVNPTSIASQGLGIKNPLLAMGVDIALMNPKGSLKTLKGIGKIGKVSNFALDKNTFDELVNAGEMMKNPQNNLHLIDTSKFRTKAEALKEIQKMGADIVDRVSGKYLPDKQLLKLKTPEAKLKALVDLSKENKLANVSTPVSNFVGNKPTQPKPEVPEKYAFNINKNRLNIPEVNKKVIDTTVNDIKPELQSVKGAKLTNQEVIDAAKTSDVLKHIVTRDETAAFNAALLKTRQTVAAGAAGKGISKDFIDALKVQSSIAADWGRRGNALAIGADPLLNDPIKNQITKKLMDLGKNTDEIVKASENVNFENPKEVTAFYRQFVKPNMGEILNEYRYINLLSSPKTHIVNAFSNLLQAGAVSPGTKLFTGAVDAIGSTLTGKQRENYVREVPAYYKGLFNSIGEATDKMSKAFKGESFIERPDVSRLPTGKLGGLQAIPRALEASDAFFRTLIKGAEKEALAYKYTRMGKEISAAKLDSIATDKASYFVFRKALDSANKTGQGKLLANIDRLTESIYTLRKVPGVSWFIPFVQTPMNILKQGIEYSPLGVATLPGAANKTEQIGKALLGSTVMAGTAYAIQAGDSTWSAPVGEKDKEAFYAAGRQPYSIKIGNEWVSYSRLGPLAYPMAMAAAVKYYTQQDPKSITKTKLQQVGSALSGMAKFFSDQSYVQGLGDLVKTIQGDTTAAKQAVANFPAQVIPLESLLGWVARIIDPIYRHPGSPVESLKTQIPGLSKQVPAYTNPAGLPSKRQNLMFNAFSPVSATPNVPGYENYLNMRQTNSRYDLIKKQIKDAATSGDMVTAKRLIKENKDLLTKGAVSNKLTGKTDKMIQARDRIMKDKTLTEQQRQKLLNSLDKYIQQVSAVANH